LNKLFIEVVTKNDNVSGNTLNNDETHSENQISFEEKLDSASEFDSSSWISPEGTVETLVLFTNMDDTTSKIYGNILQFMGAEKNLEFYGKSNPAPLAVQKSLLANRNRQLLTAGKTLVDFEKELDSISDEEMFKMIDRVDLFSFDAEKQELQSLENSQANLSTVEALKEKMLAGSAPTEIEEEEETEEAALTRTTEAARNDELTGILYDYKDNLCSYSCQPVSCCMIEIWSNNCVAKAGIGFKTDTSTIEDVAKSYKQSEGCMSVDDAVNSVEAIGKVKDNCRYVLGELYLKGKNFNLPWKTSFYIDPMQVTLAKGTCIWVSNTTKEDPSVTDKIKPYINTRIMYSPCASYCTNNLASVPEGKKIKGTSDQPNDANTCLVVRLFEK